ncbi:hypothetical protein MRGR3_1634 [Staphylococcus aureus subsp. aureus MRGR3]|nr:hypothetical protein S091751_2813 [Staphylococcus aureus subsp. aureus 091751]EOR36757.1 hypothetical protein S103564_0497 [Staphylococcus aureus subsp. aureus 103564]EOR39759.1 hypothetical protein MRGR3_1634 [Staphylococcus aureus subsp. aureus MRGR3]
MNNEIIVNNISNRSKIFPFNKYFITNFSPFKLMIIIIIDNISH